MAQIIDEVSRTFNEYLLIPGLTTKECTPDRVNLSTLSQDTKGKCLR